MKEVLLGHDEVFIFVVHSCVISLDGEVRQVLVGILNIIEIILRPADSQIKFVEHIYLKRIEACHKNPLSDVKLPHAVEVVKKEWPLDVLLHNFWLRLTVFHVGLELGKAIIDTINTKSSSIIARFYNPNVPGAIGRVLGDQFLHALVVLDQLYNEKHRGSFPSVVKVAVLTKILVLLAIIAWLN